MERILITKIVRRGDRADLYARGHQYPDLRLFDLSDLADVGVDYANLAEGAETPARFWAAYELSEKLNKAGNPYKDIVALEPIGAPATTTSADNSALLAELRAVRALLQAMAQAQGVTAPADPDPEPAVSDLDAEFPRFGDGSPVPDAALEYYREHVTATGTLPQTVDVLRAWALHHAKNTTVGGNK
jgi:hypothetical protein